MTGQRPYDGFALVAPEGPTLQGRPTEESARLKRAIILILRTTTDGA